MLTLRATTKNDVLRYLAEQIATWTEDQLRPATVAVPVRGVRRRRRQHRRRERVLQRRADPTLATASCRGAYAVATSSRYPGVITGDRARRVARGGRASRWCGPEASAPGRVRLRAHQVSGVRVPAGSRLRPVTESYCVAMRRGGEPLEVNNQSVREKPDSAGCGDEPACQWRSRTPSPSWRREPLARRVHAATRGRRRCLGTEWLEGLVT